jgi:FliI/YscN family ATPase
MPGWMRHSVQADSLQGSVVHAPLSRSFIGERCLVMTPGQESVVLCEAQTVSFTPTGVRLSLLGTTQGLPKGAWIVPTGRAAGMHVSHATLGSVLDGEGHIIARLSPEPAESGSSSPLDVEAGPPPLTDRRPTDAVFATGVRAIDGLLTCGVGQRVGIFATAGAGKTSLVSTLIANAEVDVTIVGLIGERGREAAEFLAGGVPENRRASTVLVCSTSDRPPAERRNAAHLAAALAEHYRNAGLSVLLLVDSITRYARALRDIALSAGEPAARRGYPASVFEALPRFLERAGATEAGSITAYYTVLLDDEDQADPISEEVRSILDGHIHLSRSLAERAHYPAIDILKSASRVMHGIVTARHREHAVALRGKLARLAELELPLQLGEYHPGDDVEVDALLDCRDDIDQWLRQPGPACTTFADTLRGLRALA